MGEVQLHLHSKLIMSLDIKSKKTSQGYLQDTLNRPSRRKGYLSKRVKMVRSVIREVTGLAPYERRIVELLKTGRERRALKLAKRRIGSYTRGKKKKEELAGLFRKGQKKVLVT